MNNNKLVSCIIIFLNAERFLEEAVLSIIKQTYSNWEILLIDDGSTDKSTDIALNFCRKYPKQIFYFEHHGHTNLGMSASRNLGISKSRGEFITFLDSDDVWCSEKLEQQIEILLNYSDAAMVYGKALIWHSWANSKETSEKDYYFDLGVIPNKLYHPPTLFYLLLRNKAQTPMTSNVMLRKGIFTTVGGFEDDFTTMYEDQVFFSKVNLRFPVFVSEICWFKYRQHNQSCTNQESGSYWKHRRPFLNWLSKYLLTNGYDNTEQIKKVKRELRLSFFPIFYKRYYSIVDKLKNNEQ